MKPLVSILIPARNAERWIGASVSSALGQTWKRIEVIVVDDGSEDRTLEALRPLCSPRLLVTGQENRGASAARNRAFSLAQGDYIQWLDADDLLAPDKIEQQLRGGDRDGDVALSAAWGRFFHDPRRAVFEESALWRSQTPREWLLARFVRNVWMHPAVWLVARELAEQTGPWDERLSFDDDGEFFCRLVARSRNVQFVARSICYYRQGNFGSLSWSRSDRALDSLFLSVRRSIDHLRSLGDDEEARDACLRYLQHQIGYFHPHRTDILEQAADLAEALGGELTPPVTPWAFGLCARVFGWDRAKKAKDRYWRMKVGSRKAWDGLQQALHGAGGDHAGLNAVGRGALSSRNAGSRGSRFR